MNEATVPELLALTWRAGQTIEPLMTYIQLSEKHDAVGFLVLAKSGAPVYCLAGNIYGVRPEQTKLLKRKQIPCKKLKARNVHLPKSFVAA